MKNKRIRSLGRSFRWAARGIRMCIRNERNMRIHLTAAFYLAVFGPIFRLTVEQQCIIMLCVAMVIALEMVNTAIEAVINLCSPQYHALAGMGKDIAAGAVMVAAFFSAVIGIRLFWKPDVIWLLFKTAVLNPGILLLMLVGFIWSCVFIFIGPLEVNQWIKEKYRQFKNRNR